MSTRGGRGGGRGGGQKTGMRNLDIEFDPELVNQVESAPSATYPPVQPPVADFPTSQERRFVSHYKSFRARIHNGPYYAVLGDNIRIAKTPSGRKVRDTAEAHFDAFGAQPTYTQIHFRPPRNTIPRLNTRPYVMDLFPRELWATIDPAKYGSGAGQKTQERKRTLGVAKRSKIDKIFDRIAETEDAVPGGAGDKEDPDAEDVTNDPKEPDENADDDEKEDGSGDDQDEHDADQFSEDDDNDDYNAEMYFDDGGDGDDGDAGDDGGGAEDY